ncbi:hypothetical protein [Nocardia sp. NPDC005998]|uniref:hypothetical protein n=1 Tax=Nocardia sp. NPDC005998 TaxID=3156894 RepID=UPI0033B466EB
MTLSDEDKDEPCLWEASTGSKQYRNMIDFLRKRYKDYSKSQEADDRFFRIELAAGERYSKSGRRQRKVGLYFQKSNLYLRAWTIDGDDPDGDADRPEVFFMAGWTREEFNKGGPMSLLPAKGRGYLGSAPGRRGGPYIDLSYGGTIGDQLSKTRFFDCASDLYEYLYPLKEIQTTQHRQPTGDEINKGINNAEKALHLLAKMTSEMARFDLYKERLSAKWVAGMGQNEFLRSGYDWDESRPEKTPEFIHAITSWQNFSKKADNGKEKCEYLGREVTPEMAAELLGKNGARWRKL